MSHSATGGSSDAYRPTAAASFEKAARRWRDEDPDPETRAELDALLARGDEAELADRFSQRLTFGTAGLRGPMGAGPNRMNVATVRYAAAGIARWLDGAGTVVIGYDARRKSDVFAVESACVLAAAGVRTLLLPRALPTPVLAWAVRHLGASAGVMVTASHNPPGDNGYKVYARDGAQIIPPTDEQIAAAIDEFTSLGGIPVAERDDPRIELLGDDIVEAYLSAACAAVPASSAPAASLSIVYTPLHGVGGALFVELVKRSGFAEPHVVAAQAEPDPAFPTVAFPNPEEPGALDLAVADADARGADLVVANDPDADRLAVAIPSSAGWRRLTGDEVGVLLADHLLARAGTDDRTPLVATTVVSSRLLGKLAADQGAAYAETLTGFKWVARPAIDHPELRAVLSYEEALGYSVGELVRDKDGLTAGLAFLALSAEAKARGESIADRLDGLARRYGLHVTGQLSLRDDAAGGLGRLRDTIAAVRRSPPSRLADRRVTRVRDLLVDHEPPPGSGGGPLAPTDALIFELDDSSRVVLRPSGTEPKLKAYVEVVAEDRPAAETALKDLQSAVADLLERGRAT